MMYRVRVDELKNMADDSCMHRPNVRKSLKNEIPIF
jgi:hypothetical protein